MKDLYSYLILEGKTVKDLGVDPELLKQFINEWVLSEDGYNPSRKTDKAMDVYNSLVDALRPSVRNYKDGIKALYNYCYDFVNKLIECGAYNITDDMIQILIDRISCMPANKLENLLGAGEEGAVVELHDNVVKLFYGDKIPKDKIEYYKACKSKKYDVFPVVERIGKGYVVMEKLKMYTEKCNDYQYVIDKLYNEIKDEDYNIEDYTEQEQQVINWFEKVKKAVSETTKFSDIGDLDEKNFGERTDGTIVYFDI